MTENVYRGRVTGGTIILEEGAELPDGTEVLITAIQPPAGSAEAVLAAVKRPPHLSHDQVEEFRRLIKEARLPSRYDNPLDYRPES